MSALHPGGCACGAIRFAATGAPSFAFLCHCRACQQLSGTGHAAAIAYATDTFEVTGSPAVYSRASESGLTVAQHFCPSCGSPLFNRPDAAPGLVMINHGAFDQPGSFTPDKVFHGDDAPIWDRVPWHDYGAP